MVDNHLIPHCVLYKKKKNTNIFFLHKDLTLTVRTWELWVLSYDCILQGLNILVPLIFFFFFFFSYTSCFENWCIRILSAYGFSEISALWFFFPWILSVSVSDFLGNNLFNCYYALSTEYFGFFFLIYWLSINLFTLFIYF